MQKEKNIQVSAAKLQCIKHLFCVYLFENLASIAAFPGVSVQLKKNCLCLVYSVVGTKKAAERSKCFIREGQKYVKYIFLEHWHSLYIMLSSYSHLHSAEQKKKS